VTGIDFVSLANESGEFLVVELIQPMKDHASQSLVKAINLRSKENFCHVPTLVFLLALTFPDKVLPPGDVRIRLTGPFDTGC